MKSSDTKGMRRTATITTAIFSLAQTGAAITYLVHYEPVVSIIHHLGYPDYFRTMLAAGKLAGVAALVLPVPPRLREWAYAGFTFDLLAATVSHLAVGDPIGLTVRPVFTLGLMVASYLSRRRLAGSEERRPRAVRPGVAPAEAAL